ncbi:MAG: zinc ribbon domain-containing protein [Myxococcales bacterium]|nr:zinc ribbon domain-containing protein [Myxococcales bacterium]
MSTINFQCASCDGDFDIEILHLLERPGALKCPHCGNRPQAHRAQQFAQALEDVLTAMAALRSKIRFELQLDTDALPAPYGGDDDADAGLGRLDDEDDDDDDDDALGELSFDDEDDFEDENDDFDDEDDEDDEDDARY